MKKTSILVAIVALSGTFALAGEQGAFVGSAPQTEVLVGETPDTYGTGALTSYMMASTWFETRSNTTAYVTNGGFDKFSSNSGLFDASPMLPNGSQIERVELRACDTDALASVILNMGPCPTIGANCTLAGSVTSGATPGCNTFATTLATPLIVDNSAAPILIQISTGTTAATSFNAVKLYYRLRISAAPAVATFPGDVPTSHPFFRFVEALAAAGVTSGCGAGLYCPDQAVTRGQMAVFLATSLGLHFPN